jgi:hypothetical protein
MVANRIIKCFGCDFASSACFVACCFGPVLDSQDVNLKFPTLYDFVKVSDIK